MNYWIWQRVLKFVLVAATARTALCLFYAREMIAALIIFSVLFACVVGVVLIVITLDCATEAAFASIEVYTRAFRLAGRRVWESAEGLTTRRLRNFSRTRRQMNAKTTCSCGDALGPTFGSDITN
jgi:hypothetical protein